MHQNAKQTIFTLLEVFMRAKNCCLCCLVFCCLFLFCQLILAYNVFLYAQNLFVKTIIRLKIVLIPSFYITTSLLLYQPPLRITFRFPDNIILHYYFITTLSTTLKNYLSIKTSAHCKNIFLSVKTHFCLCALV